jgi:hypothetical protein
MYFWPLNGAELSSPGPAIADAAIARPAQPINTERFIETPLQIPTTRNLPVTGSTTRPVRTPGTSIDSIHEIDAATTQILHFLVLPATFLAYW